MDNHIYFKGEQRKSLADLQEAAKDHCKEGTRVTNLCLSGIFMIEQINSPWINAKKEKAKEWQAKTAPDNLEFSHGAYVLPFETKNGKSGVDFLIAELKQKRDSNRACWSLLTMKELLDHEEDRSIPSFMVLQAGISDDEQTLILTAYYRALEVHKFLHINLAELSIITDKINTDFGSKFKYLDLTIHAFSAYNDPESTCLEKARMDYLDPKEIMYIIDHPEKRVDELLQLITQKMHYKESRINTIGLKEIVGSMEIRNKGEKAMDRPKPYPEDIIAMLQKVNAKIADYNKIRLFSSNAAKTNKTYKEIKAILQKVIEGLTLWKSKL